MRFILALFFILLFLSSSTISFAADSSLRCTPSSGNYKVGELIPIEILLDTRTSTASGSTVVATYDPALLEATISASTVIAGVTNWGSPVTNTVDAVLGKVTLDFGSTQSNFTGNTSIGGLGFRAKSAGQAQFNFTFFQQYDDTTPGVSKVYGKNNGSSSTTNILTDVNNCIYVIEGPTPTLGAPTTTPPIAPTATSVPVPQVDELPRSGSTEMTTLFLIIGSFSIIGGTLPFFSKTKI